MTGKAKPGLSVKREQEIAHELRARREEHWLSVLDLPRDWARWPSVNKAHRRTIERIAGESDRAAAVAEDSNQRALRALDRAVLSELSNRADVPGDLREFVETRKRFERVRNVLVVANAALAVSVANRSELLTVGELRDRVQSAMFGLILAAERFTKRGARFSTYASAFVSLYILDEDKKSALVRIPGRSGLDARELAAASQPVYLDADQNGPLGEPICFSGGERYGGEDIDRALYIIETLTEAEKLAVRRVFGLDGAAEQTLSSLSRETGHDRTWLKGKYTSGLNRLRIRMGVFDLPVAGGAR